MMVVIMMMTTNDRDDADDNAGDGDDDDDDDANFDKCSCCPCHQRVTLCRLDLPNRLSCLAVNGHHHSHPHTDVSVCLSLCLSFARAHTHTHARTNTRARAQTRTQTTLTHTHTLSLQVSGWLRRSTTAQVSCPLLSRLTIHLSNLHAHVFQSGISSHTLQDCLGARDGARA